MPGSSISFKYIVILETSSISEKKIWILLPHALKSRTVLRSLRELLHSSHRGGRLCSCTKTKKSHLDMRKVELTISGKMSWATGLCCGSAIGLGQQFSKRKSWCLFVEGRVRDNRRLVANTVCRPRSCQVIGATHRRANPNKQLLPNAVSGAVPGSVSELFGPP